jgi:dTDP-4-amino-4,6-dideoxy-D-glucose acyltransferase
MMEVVVMNLSETELHQLGLKHFGKDCRVHRTVQFFSPENISIGDNVRIDCFSLISAGPMGVCIGNHIHIGAGCYLFGNSGKIVLEDFSGMSPRSSIFTASDDYKEGYLHGPIVPEQYKKVHRGDVVLKLNACVGSGSVVLPSVTIGANACVGALTVVSHDVPGHALIFSHFLKPIARRDPQQYLDFIAAFRQEYESHGNP